MVYEKAKKNWNLRWHPITSPTYEFAQNRKNRARFCINTAFTNTPFRLRQSGCHYKILTELILSYHRLEYYFGTFRLGRSIQILCNSACCSIALSNAAIGWSHLPLLVIICLNWRKLFLPKDVLDEFLVGQPLAWKIYAALQFYMNSARTKSWLTLP